MALAAEGSSKKATKISGAEHFIVEKQKWNWAENSYQQLRDKEDWLRTSYLELVLKQDEMLGRFSKICLQILK